MVALAEFSGAAERNTISLRRDGTAAAVLRQL
jgi:hypothetical protein